MTSLDEKIRKELESETSEIDALLAREGGLPDMVAAAFQGGMRRWMWLVWGITFIVAGLMFWCGYEFFVATAMQDQVFWGFCVVIAAMMQVSLKTWVWMEMNRASMMREIKRLEVAVARLAANLGTHSR